MATVPTRTLPASPPRSLLLHAALFFIMKAVRTLLHRLTSLRAASPATHTPPPPADAPDAATAAADAPEGSSPAGGAHEFRGRLPPGSWDSHMHVLDARFPLAAAAVYTPRWHPAGEARAFAASVGLERAVVVQPSIYGTDNGCTLDGLRALGGPARARAVVAFDPARTSPAQLRAWHRLGVRGVRLNLQSVGRAPDQAALAAELARYADAVRPLGWVLQVYAALPTVALLEPLVPRLGVRVCLDHLGHPAGLGDAAAAAAGPVDPYALPGFAALVRLLRGGRTWVKLSAAYRFSGAADRMSDAVPLVREVLRVAGRRRVVFATDWPHTRYEGLDIRPWLRLVLDLCADAGGDALVERVFRGNADDLWGGHGPVDGVNRWDPDAEPVPLEAMA